MKNPPIIEMRFFLNYKFRRTYLFLFDLTDDVSRLPLKINR